jgi:hypothetical protein
MRNFRIILNTLIFNTVLFLSSVSYAQNIDQSNKKLTDDELENFLVLNHNYKKIPLTKTISGHLHINAVINGVDGYFVLDTGAGATIIETSRKEKFNLKVKNTSNSGAGAGGSQSMQLSNNNSINLENLLIENFDLYIMNLDHVNNAFKSMGLKEVDGVIGADILTIKEAIIDYSNLFLYLKI